MIAGIAALYALDAGAQAVPPQDAAPATTDATAPVTAAGNATEPGGAQAQETPTLGGASRGDRNTRAIAHYERGRVHYAAGRYRAAIVELEAAIALAPTLTDLQYDLGLVNERLGRLDAALAAYRRYQVSTGDVAERERTTRIIARLQGAQTEPLEFVWGGGRLGRADALFWSFIALSGATLVGGSVTLALGINDTNRAGELERMSDPMAMTVRNTATAEIAVSAALFAATVGLASGAGILYATRQAGTPPSLNGVCLTVAPNYAGVAVRF
ncbi:MAG: tetratricopeptide repeat protein [Myxococcales bacterium]|nr:tetratricopeptide repeat protein [Myxococcales bacterium]